MASAWDILYMLRYIRTPAGCQYTESKSRQQTHYDDMKEKKVINKEFQEAQTGEGKQKKGAAVRTAIIYREEVTALLVPV